MKAPLFVRPLTDEEEQQIQAGLHSSDRKRQMIEPDITGEEREPSNPPFELARSPLVSQNDQTLSSIAVEDAPVAPFNISLAQ